MGLCGFCPLRIARWSVLQQTKGQDTFGLTAQQLAAHTQQIQTLEAKVSTETNAAAEAAKSLSDMLRKREQTAGFASQLASQYEDESKDGSGACVRFLFSLCNSLGKRRLPVVNAVNFAN